MTQDISYYTEKYWGYEYGDLDGNFSNSIHTECK